MDKSYLYMRDCINKDDENDVVIISFDQKLPETKQIGNSLDDIKRHVLKGQMYAGKISVYPFEAASDIHTTKKRLHELFQKISRNGLAYIAENLSVAADLSNTKAEPRSDDVILDVCLLVEDMPPTVFTLVRDDTVSLDRAKSYNITLVQGVIRAVRRMTTEQFSAVYGLIHESDLITSESFQDRLNSLQEISSGMYIPDSLEMHVDKCKGIIQAFLTSVALTHSVVNEDSSDTLWFLTLEQFCILTENIEQRKVTVKTVPSSGGNVLIREVARRLEKSGPTVLVMGSEKEIQVARNQKTCSLMLTLEEWRDRLSKEVSQDEIMNMVTNCWDCPVLQQLKGKYWTFQTEKRLPTAKCEEQPQKEETDKDKSQDANTPVLSQSETGRNKDLVNELESKDIRIQKLMNEVSTLQFRLGRLDSTSMSEISEDSGFYSSMSSVARSRSSSVASGNTFGATGGQEPQKGLLKKLKSKLSFQKSRKEAKPIFVTMDGPVFCLTDQNKMNPYQLQCRQQKMDKEKVNTEKSQVTDDGRLVNLKVSNPDKSGSQRFKQHYGTCSTIPISRPYPTSASPVAQYFETETIIGLKKKLEWMTLLEVGVMEESHLDGGGRSYYRPRSSCVRVGRCETHNMDICKQVWNQGKQVKCVSTQVAVTGASFKLKYGVVVDPDRCRVGLIDLAKGSVLGAFEDEPKENLFPVFSIYPDAEEATVQMRLISGHDIVMTEDKEQLIYSCLTTM